MDGTHTHPFFAARKILITGASSGIGRDLALQLAQHGALLVLTARRSDALNQLSEQARNRGATAAIPVVGDITDPEIRSTLISTIQEKWGSLDLLINNAGISAHGRFATSSEEILRRIVEVNFFACAELTRLALPLLASGIQPMIVNVGSVLGHRAIPQNSEYCASKFALRGWSEAIRPELAKKNIDLLLASPGTIETEFFDHLLNKQGETPWPKLKGISSEEAARQILYAIRKRRKEVFPNWRGRLLVLLNRYLPGLVDRVVARYG